MKYLKVLADSKTAGSKDWGYIPYIFIIIGSTTWALTFIYTNEHNINFA
jgi:hypothetical protein